MRKSIYIFLLLLGFLSCNNNTSDEKLEINTLDSIESLKSVKILSKVLVIDSSQYDQLFIKGLSEYNEPIKLINNFVVTGNDTTYFPLDLKLRKKTIFKGIKDNREFVLIITRTNLTNLNYEFILKDKDNKIIDSKSGVAILGSLFFLAPEGDEDTEMKDGYGSYEYWDNSYNCWFSVRIGIGFDGNGKQRAKISYGCEDKNKHSLELEECPTLRTG